MRIAFAVVVVVFVALCGISKAEDGSSCITPYQEPGICKSIKQCDDLLNLLRSRSGDPEVRNYLIKSSCGYVGTDPLVCCPKPNYQTRATTQKPSGGGTIHTSGGIITGNTGNGGFPVNQGTSTGTSGNGGITGGNSGETSGRNPTPVPVVETPNDGFLRPPHCGHSNHSNDRIVGGKPAKLGEFPWIVALGYRSNNPNQPYWLCGGSLITETHVLTAAHCVHNRQTLYVVRVGDLDLYSDDDGAHPETIPLVKAKVHEKYSATEHTDDIAILTMQRKPNRQSAWPICLPVDPAMRQKNYDRFNMFVAGWGSTYYKGPSSNTLMKIFIPVVPQNQCKASFDSLPAAKVTIDERVLCAGMLSGKDSCQGDSGGPLMLGHTIDQFYQIGIVSLGYKCAEPGFAGIYTRVTNYIEWIGENIK
ncbi:PREDICTED: venom protease-like isoform X2 [Nicrophorus vespilloides]|uniref:CLIP domain-containing serine protease n=1 Tax=Nicrophorus vespilloides TaxID=110193 RepID=A0ABM1NKH2_NICVS|nr:PREDICTED: venom protease-like isoform X2 [Nicrophorus vespilloides]